MTFDDFKEQLHNLGVFKRSTSARIVFDELQETYAKPVEMLPSEMLEIQIAKESELSFGQAVAGYGQYAFSLEMLARHSEEVLMRAWLHPELIKVVE